MTERLFGTDGIRGLAGQGNMAPDRILAVGAAVGRHFRQDGDTSRRVVIGKDTRLSSYMVEAALTAGLTSAGLNVHLLGPVPTPAVGYLTRSMRADLGIMVSASHNPYHDNGIKLFGADGYKLGDDDERAIEALVASGAVATPGIAPERIGRARRVDDGLYRYMDRVKSVLPRDTSLKGLRVVLDCANGAAWRAAPEVLWELGAEVFPLGTEPNGTNINTECGSTDTAKAAAMVRRYRADLGVCLDGDADRVILIDETGRPCDGDQIIALMAGTRARQGRLDTPTIATTIMSNIGLERYLAGIGLSMTRTPVGDRHIVEEMRRSGLQLGGEPSGHIVMADHATTGDGLAAALVVIDAMQRSGEPASSALSVFDPVPQRLENIRLPRPGGDPLKASDVEAAIARARDILGEDGRLIVRNSGTEPLVRIMAECDDAARRDSAIDCVAQALTRENGTS